MNKLFILVLLVCSGFFIFGCTSGPSVAISEGSTMVTVVDINGFTHNIKLKDLNDVTVIGITPAGYALVWNGSAWVPADVNFDPTKIAPDTNWQTSWSVFDANMKAYYLLKTDGNVFYYKKTDFNYLTFLTSYTDTNTQTAGWTSASGVWSGIDLNVNGKNVYLDKNLVVGTNKFFVNGTTGNVGIGTTSPSGRLHVADTSSTGIALFERSAQASDAAWVAARVLATRTTDMIDGFGSALGFNIRDDAGVINPIGYIGAVRAGADNTGDIIFRTVAAGSTNEKVRITSAGNVGIGTTAPAGKLDVKDGGIAFTDADVAHGITGAGFGWSTDSYSYFKSLNDLNGGLGLYAGSDTDASALSITGVMGSTDPSDTTPAVMFRGGKKDAGTSWDALAAAETVFQFRNYTSSLMTMLGNGNTGIGTTTPTKKLDVVGDIKIGDGSGDGYGRLFLNQKYDRTYPTIVMVGVDDGTYSELNFGGGTSVGYAVRDIYFRTAVDENTVTGSVRMSINKDGNVAIGTHSSKAPLDIKTAASTWGRAMRLGSQGTVDNHGAYIEFTSSSTDGYGAQIGGIRTTAGENALIIKTGSNTQLERMRVDNNGDVGIGTANPVYKLDVNSGGGISIYADGNVSAAGYITRTDVYDKSKGSALSKLKDASAYKTGNDINHAAFEYSKVSYDKQVFDKMITSTKDVNVCTPQPAVMIKQPDLCETVSNCETIKGECADIFGLELSCEEDKEVCAEKEVCTPQPDLEVRQPDKCEIKQEQVETPTYKIIQEEGVSLDKEVALLKQALYELNVKYDKMCKANPTIKECN